MKEKNRNHWLARMAGSIILFAVSACVVPPLINKLSAKAYRASNGAIEEDDLFPEPTIVKIAPKNEEEEENDG